MQPKEHDITDSSNSTIMIETYQKICKAAQVEVPFRLWFMLSCTQPNLNHNSQVKSF